MAIDRLSFNFKVLEVDKEMCTVRPTVCFYFFLFVYKIIKDGVYIYGLFLEGASWDKQKKSVVDAQAGEKTCIMPVIYLQPSDKYVERPEYYV